MKQKLQKEILSTWLTEYIDDLTGEPIEDIDTSAKLFEYDLDSIDSLRMAVEMEQALGIEVPPDTFFDGLTTLDEVIDLFKSD